MVGAAKEQPLKVSPITLSEFTHADIGSLGITKGNFKQRSGNV
jgi:hypothetical protein